MDTVSGMRTKIQHLGEQIINELFDSPIDDRLTNIMSNLIQNTLLHKQKFGSHMSTNTIHSFKHIYNVLKMFREAEDLRFIYCANYFISYLKEFQPRKNIESVHALGGIFSRRFRAYCSKHRELTLVAVIDKFILNPNTRHCLRCNSATIESAGHIYIPGICELFAENININLYIQSTEKLDMLLAIPDVRIVLESTKRHSHNSASFLSYGDLYQSTDLEDIVAGLKVPKNESSKATSPTYTLLNPDSPPFVPKVIGQEPKADKKEEGLPGEECKMKENGPLPNQCPQS